MKIADGFIAELQHESIATRKTLERAPIEKNEYRPHEKSMMLGNMAIHIAELPAYIKAIITADELDFLKMDYKPRTITTTEDLLKEYDTNIAESIELLKNTSDEDMLRPWTLRSGEHIIFTQPKMVAIRTMVLSHIIHHRAQLGVYLRLNNISVPAIYGPTADEQF